MRQQNSELKKIDGDKRTPGDVLARWSSTFLCTAVAEHSMLLLRLQAILGVVLYRAEDHSEDLLVGGRFSPSTAP
jgi:hypothetical protein